MGKRPSCVKAVRDVAEFISSLDKGAVLSPPSRVELDTTPENPVEIRLEKKPRRKAK